MRIDFKKLRKLKNRYLSGKAAILFLLNRKVAAMTGDDDFGELTDLHFDREAKNIELEISRGLNINTLSIEGYGVVVRKGAPWLVWRETRIAGPDTERYTRIFANRELELTKRYAALIEAIL